MTELSIDLKKILSQIREQTFYIIKEGWPEMSELMNVMLPDPLDPMALLPIAVSVAVGADAEELIPISASVLLFDLSLRIIDDCADLDNPKALHLAIGKGAAINYAMSFNALALKKIWEEGRTHNVSDALLANYFEAYLNVCKGQHSDLNVIANTLDEYKNIVRMKTVAAYEFATVIGSLTVVSNESDVKLCRECGNRIAWMSQILNDIEGLWFPQTTNNRELEKGSFPVLYALESDEVNAQKLRKIYSSKNLNRKAVCSLLDEMNIRTQLIELAMDYRDEALKIIHKARNPEGEKILKIWFDWMLRDTTHLLR
jgi:geranylgeranyl pyrophosphate synthase